MDVGWEVLLAQSPNLFILGLMALNPVWRLLRAIIHLSSQMLICSQSLHIRCRKRKTSCHSIVPFCPLNRRKPISSVSAIILLLRHPRVLPLEVHRPTSHNYRPLQQRIHIIRDEQRWPARATKRPVHGNSSIGLAVMICPQIVFAGMDSEFLRHDMLDEY